MEAINAERGVRDVILYGDRKNYKDSVGILVFNLRMFKNDEVASYLADHAAIAVRRAKFCAHTYVNNLLSKVENDSDEVTDATDATDVSHEGMVRVSFGLYNTKSDVDALVAAARDMLKGGKRAATDALQIKKAARKLAMPNDRG